MPRKKRTPAPETAVTPPATHTVETAEPITPASAEPARPEPDVFDQAIAARHAQAAAATPAPADEPIATATDRDGDARNWQVQPDPHGFYSVALTDANDGPRIHLYRSRRFNQVAVRFDEKPDESVRQRMHDEGYRWRQAEGVWTKQLGEHRVSGQIAAERLVDELANAIRAERGLAPVGQAVGA